VVVPTDVSKPAAVKALFTKAKKGLSGRIESAGSTLPAIFGSPAFARRPDPRTMETGRRYQPERAHSFAPRKRFRIMKKPEAALAGRDSSITGSISAHAPAAQFPRLITASKHAIMGF